MGNTAGADLCLVSVWAGTRPLPPLRVWSPRRSEFAPLGVASLPAFWGSSERPTHRPMARRDTADTSHRSLRGRRKVKSHLISRLHEGLKEGSVGITLTTVFYIRHVWSLRLPLPHKLLGVLLLFDTNLHIQTLYKYPITAWPYYDPSNQWSLLALTSSVFTVQSKRHKPSQLLISNG